MEWEPQERVPGEAGVLGVPKWEIVNKQMMLQSILFRLQTPYELGYLDLEAVAVEDEHVGVPEFGLFGTNKLMLQLNIKSIYAHHPHHVTK